MLTGGMSWGDAPTTSYEDFQRINAIDGMWELLEGWAKEDREEESRRKDNNE